MKLLKFKTFIAALLCLTLLTSVWAQPAPDEITPEGKAESEAESKEEPVDLGGLNLVQLEMKKLLPKMAGWTGKVIIPDKKLENVKLTIYSSGKHTKTQILRHIYAALEVQGYIVEEREDTIFIKPLLDSGVGFVPVIPEEVPLVSVEDKSKTVQKVFKLSVYSPGEMRNLLLSMVQERKDARIIADDSTNTLIAIDTVSSLIRMENIIRELDVSEADQTITETISVSTGDAVSIVQILEILLRTDAPNNRRNSSNQSGGGASTSFTGPSSNPVVLIPMPDQNWIIARAFAADMRLIKEWVEKLDIEESEKVDQEMVSVSYLDVNELASRLNAGIEQNPRSGMRPDVFVQALPKAKKILLFGSERNRLRIKAFIAEMDLPSDKFLTRKFDLEHADPDQIKEYLEKLYQEEEETNSRFSYYSRRNQNDDDEDFVRVIANPILNQVTVIASPEKMNRIELQIEEWDQPLSLDDVKPLIVTLKNSDPVKMTELLSTLFSDSSSSGGGFSYYDFFRGGGSNEKEKIIGALYGQLTFEAVPDTKKIIVISKIPQAYAVIEELIHELDSEDVAELPTVVVLKYADAEELCDQLNALLNEQGTTATLRRSSRGLSPTSLAQDAANSGSNNSTGARQGNNNNSPNNDEANPEVIKPWWTTGRPSESETPTSNLIGKLRFIPVHRSKAILVLAPKDYLKSIREMIEVLDQPGKQVLINAVIIQVDRRKLDSLGTKISSNPLALGDIGENALTALTNISGGRSNVNFGNDVTGQFGFGGSMSVLIDVLRKEAAARVLNQPTLWTMDNEEAEFFRGDQIALKANQRITDNNAIISDFTYRSVGVILRVRPNITPENAVNLTLNLEISTVKPEPVNGEVAIQQLSTSTRMSARDGETVMLGGIIFQSDTQINTKTPILSDIPLLGRLFSHEENEQTDNELLVFITPTVIDNGTELRNDPQIKESLRRMEEAREKLKAASPKFSEE